MEYKLDLAMHNESPVGVCRNIENMTFLSKIVHFTLPKIDIKSMSSAPNAFFVVYLGPKQYI